MRKVALAPVKTLIDAIFAYPPVMTFIYVALIVAASTFVTLIELEMNTFPVTLSES